METRLSRICDAIIEAGWLAALVVTPLFFNTFSSRVFEPDKLHLLRSIALVMAVAWIVQLLDARLARRQRGAAEPVGAAARDAAGPAHAGAGASATWSAPRSRSCPRISFLGSYVRMQGTFTFLSYVVIFAMVLTHLRSRAQVNRLIHTVILTSLPIASTASSSKPGSTRCRGAAMWSSAWRPTWATRSSWPPT